MPTLDNHQSDRFTKPQRIRGTLFERFKNYCSVPDPTTGCIIWQASKNKAGYGQIMNDNSTVRRPLLAHRVAWEIAGYKLEPNLEILHICNNPACVNVDHLEQGTHKINMEQAGRDGLMKGPRKFTKQDCDWVKSQVAKGYKKKDIAFDLGCSPPLITKILKGQLKYANA